MMKHLISLFVVVTLLCGCASAPIAQDEYPIEMQRAAAVLDSVDNKIWGDISASDNSMASFTLDRYKEILSTFKSNRAKELQDNLKTYNTVVLKGFENTFVLCVFSAEQSFAMCDDARCSTVEKQALTSSPDIIDSWWKELPLVTCPKH